ncbi:MAG: protease inhibitor I42 family protein [Betaproteobacteria bacterium]|nr:protease inhibitor I42 family protein [Betaproteobacteria bacterium]
MAELALGPADDGRAFDARPGTMIVIELPENPTTGFRWSLRSKVAPVLVLKADPFVPPQNTRPGAGGSRRFEFTASTIGSAGIVLWNWREWEGEGSVAKRYQVTVRVK